MKKSISINQIRDKAREFAEKGKSWHFHILTPECKFNDSKDYAFVLENSSDNEVFVSYSDKPQMEAGKELVKLLHGKDVVKDSDKSEEGVRSGVPESVGKILERAEELNREGKFWHHHILFPDCTFNKNKGKWMIVFEDQEKGELLEASFDGEPKSALKKIETLFYNQKK